MQEYYRTAKKVTQLNTILMLNFGVAFFPNRHPVAININERFQCVRELLDVRDEGVFERHPSVLARPTRPAPAGPSSSPAWPPPSKSSP